MLRFPFVFGALAKRQVHLRYTLDSLFIEKYVIGGLEYEQFTVVASTMAKMSTRIADGSFGHASMSRARSRSLRFLLRAYKACRRKLFLLFLYLRNWHGDLKSLQARPQQITHLVA